ncbi:MAG: ABC transporter ATP-binding protein [Bacteroidales bacterium]|nr:ABC transporter ATP-binding protein [Bacteroidales bacterium]
MIRTEHIIYKVKGKEILSDVGFHLQKGDFCAVVGMNGSGKSTLLKHLCRVVEPTSGDIFIKQKNIKKYSVKDLAKEVSVVFQSDDINLDFCALQIVLMGRTPYQRIFDKDKEEDLLKAEDAMRKTNTLHLKNRLFPSLSGGEKQRVLIARALCQDTPVILLDEPIANLDLKHQFEIMELLQRINKENQATIFIILHDLSFALQYANKVLALKEGKIRFFGNSKEVLTEENIKEIFEVRATIINNNNIILQQQKI